MHSDASKMEVLITWVQTLKLYLLASGPSNFGSNELGHQWKVKEVQTLWFKHQQLQFPCAESGFVRRIQKGWPNTYFLQLFNQLSILVHVHHDVTSTDKFAAHEDLWYCRPFRVLLYSWNRKKSKSQLKAKPKHTYNSTMLPIKVHSHSLSNRPAQTLWTTTLKPFDRVSLLCPSQHWDLMGLVVLTVDASLYECEGDPKIEYWLINV